MNLSKASIALFQKRIFLWWKTHRRDLPWRRTHDPYKILISEVMLQQTQVSRVLPKYDEFLKSFSDVWALASASPASVLRTWKGMGYNRRALYLRKTAKIIVDKYSGIFPDDEKELRKLPGLGMYTAHALLVFAFRKDVAMVDTNIRQIITHFFFDDKLQTPPVIQKAADALVPKKRSWEWHQALMDYGSAESSKFKIQRLKLKKQVKSFRESNRFYRGKILDLLRERTVAKRQLYKEFEKSYGKSKGELDEIIIQLHKEQLVAIKNNRVYLPEE